MSDVTYEINGKTYTEDELISVYQFWQKHCDIEDIDDAVSHAIEHSNDEKLSDFVKVNSSKVKNACIEHIPLWHENQRDTLNSWEETIFDFALELIDCMYYDERR